MIPENLDTMYEEIYKKNDEIQTLLVEVKDYNDILAFLYDTDIRRPNLVLNSMIDNYESSILKIRELHNNIIKNLDEFGQESQLADAISGNENLAEKVKELMLWKLRRIFMVYDQEPVMPYIEGDLISVELSGDEGDSEPGGAASTSGDETGETGEPVEADTDEAAETVNPEGGLFSNSNPGNPTGNPA